MNVSADVVHTFFEEPPWLFSESAFAEFSLLYTTRSSLDLTFKQSGKNLTHKQAAADVLALLDELAAKSHKGASKEPLNLA
jgi:hypothetical protein